VVTFLTSVLMPESVSRGVSVLHIVDQKCWSLGPQPGCLTVLTILTFLTFRCSARCYSSGPEL